jgi:hypothetical protein
MPGCPDAHVREQFEILEDHADVGAQLREIGLGVADGGAVTMMRRSGKVPGR